MGKLYDDVIQQYRAVYQKYMEYSDDEMPEDEDLIYVALRADCRTMEKELEKRETKINMDFFNNKGRADG